MDDARLGLPALCMKRFQQSRDDFPCHLLDSPLKFRPQTVPLQVQFADAKEHIPKEDRPALLPVDHVRHYLLYFLIETLLVVGYGWVVKYRLHAAVPIVMQFFICALSTLLSHTASVLLVDIFPDRSSSAYAAGQVMRCGLSAASAAVVQPVVKSVGSG